MRSTILEEERAALCTGAVRERTSTTSAAGLSGCFRPRDDEHTAECRKKLGEDCASCHDTLAMDEPDPKILTGFYPTIVHLRPRRGDKTR